MLKKTICSIFMVPTLGISKELRTKYGFLNGYVGDIQREDYGDDYIHLLFQPSDNDIFQDFVSQEYDRTDQLIEDYYYDDEFVVLIYKLDSRWKLDFELVREGKYSKTSREFQKLFPQVAKIVDSKGLHRDRISLQYQIFKKTTDMKEYWENKLGTSFTDDMEVWDKYDHTKEILNIKNVKRRLNEINANEKSY